MRARGRARSPRGAPHPGAGVSCSTTTGPRRTNGAGIATQLNLLRRDPPTSAPGTDAGSSPAAGSGPLAPSCGNQPARAAAVAVFAEVDSLPGAERGPPAAERDRQRRPEQRRLDVRRHVIGPLERVGPVGSALRYCLVEPALKIPSHLR